MIRLDDDVKRRIRKVFHDHVWDSETISREYKHAVAREENVTIALGFTCNDGAVLCSDRQVTKEGGLKFAQRKILVGAIVGQIPFEFALTYAGWPEVAKDMYDDLGYAFLKVAEGDAFTPRMVRDAVKTVCMKHKNSKHVEMLIIFGSKTIQPFMIRTKGTQVVPAAREYVGVGDSSVIRYFSDLIPPEISIEEAKGIGVYLVAIASRYVEGCGLGMDVASIGKDGEVKQTPPIGIKRHLRHLRSIETCITNVFRDRK